MPSRPGATDRSWCFSGNYITRLHTHLDKISSQYHHNEDLCVQCERGRLHQITPLFEAAAIDRKPSLA